MAKPKIKILDSQTGEEITREMTDEEYSHHLEVLAQIEAEKQKLEQKQAAQAKLEALGLTADDLKALGL